ncbi:MAG: cysteine desulfurase family protein [Thermodesulfobacteriota bacterium]|nr:cysteine desulfurase family protein [Thermodesulfobacteriota bacterium]
MKIQKEAFIYLDHNATTPVAHEAVEAMMPFLKERFGNPSSGYLLGASAREGLDRARREVSLLLGCQEDEVVFTSGGSESNNMVLKGVIDFKNPDSSHIITSAVEHPAVLNPASFLSALGVEVTMVPVDGLGRIDPDRVQKAILPNTTLITLMLANNETGTLQPVREVSEMARERGIPVHTDAAQAVGKIDVNVNELGVDFLTLAGHKLYGPKGVGALYIRKGRDITPLIHGAAQERGRRAGTENVILASGLGAACRVARHRLKDDFQNMEMMRNRLQGRLFEGIEGLVLNGHAEQRLPNTLNVSVPGVEGGRILEGLPVIMASTGAACHDRRVKLSHVLAAMAVDWEIGMGALRFSLGRSNTMDEIEEAARLIIDQVMRIRV